MDLMVTSDYHGEVEAARSVAKYAKQRSIDAMIVCGDLTHAGTEEDASDILSTLLEATSNVLYVSGNFDPPEISEGVKGAGGICLHRRSYSLRGYTFLGVSGAIPAPFYSPFNISEDEIDAILKVTLRSVEQKEKLVLVSHDPPYSTSLDRTTRGMNVGSKSIKQFILREKPVLAACGHIHESAGIEEVNSTLAVNPGPAFARKAALVSLEPKIAGSLIKI